MIVDRDGKFIAVSSVEQPQQIDSDVDSEPNFPISADPSSSRAVSAFPIYTTGSDVATVNINVEIRIDASVSDLETLGSRIRDVIQQISRSDSVNGSESPLDAER